MEEEEKIMKIIENQEKFMRDIFLDLHIRLCNIEKTLKEHIETRDCCPHTTIIKKTEV